MRTSMKATLVALGASMLLSVPVFAQGSKEAAPAAQTESVAQDASGKLSPNPVTIRVMMMDHPNQPCKNYGPAQQEIFKRTNVKLDYEIIPYSSFDEKKSVLLATNNWPDIGYIRASDIPTYANTGIFEPLMQYVNEKDMPNFYKFWQKFPDMKKYLVGGELYAFPVVQREETANGFGPVMRTDLLQKANLPVPQTWDEVIDTVGELQKQNPGTIGITGRKGTKQLMKTLSYFLGSGYGSNGLYYDYDKGGYVYGPATQEFKAVLRWLNKAYTKGVLDPDFATTTKEQMDSKLSSGKALMYIDNSGFGQTYTLSLRKVPGQENGTLQIIPIPANEFGQRRAISYTKDLADRFFAVNASGKNIKTCIKLIDWMYGKEGSDVTNYGIEGYSYELDKDGNPQFLQSYLDKMKAANPNVTYYDIYADLGITKLNFTMYTCNTKTWFQLDKALGNWNEVSDEYWSIIASDSAYKPPVIDPPLSPEQAEEAADLLNDLSNIVDQQYDKYIMGVEPIDNWDSVIKQCDAKARKLEKIYNDANRLFK